MIDTILLGISLLFSAIQDSVYSRCQRSIQVYKNQLQIGTVFSILLDAYSQPLNVVHARRLRSEAYIWH